MRKIKHIAPILSALILAFISCERADVNRPDVQEGGRPIQFTVGNEWPEITKAPIESLDDLKGDGFLVFAEWTKDPEDDSYYANADGQVYGTYGVLVNAIDNNNDGVFDPNGSEGDYWQCTDEQNWYRGYYSFAALLPASQFNATFTAPYATHSADFTFTTDADGNVADVTYKNTITVSFGAGGFNLASSQIDLMYAFYNKDNSADGADKVTLDFHHAFAKLGIRLTANDPEKIPDVTGISVYGLYNSIADDLIFTHTNTQTQTIVSDNINSILATRSNSDNPYYSISGGAFTRTETELILFEDILVFPQTMTSDHPLIVRITYDTEDEEGKTYDIKIMNVTWEPGGTYIYSVLMDNLEQ